MKRFLSGVYHLDEDLGGGLTPGLLEIWGPESAGKLSLALSYLREASESRHLTAIVHTQGMPDEVYCHNAGDPDSVVVVPGSGEAALEAVYHLLCGGVSCILLHSLPSMAPASYAKHNLTEGFDNTYRKMVHHGLSSIKAKAKAMRALVIVTNQVRWAGPGEGLQPFLGTTTELLVNHRIECTPLEYERQLGQAYRTSITVNVEFAGRLYSTTRPAAVDLWPDMGIRPEVQALSYLHRNDVITLHGSWWQTLVANKRLHGRKEMHKHIAQNYGLYRQHVLDTLSRNARRQ
jgi:hypothetical protein